MSLGIIISSPRYQKESETSQGAAPKPYSGAAQLDCMGCTHNTGLLAVRVSHAWGNQYKGAGGGGAPQASYDKQTTNVGAETAFGHDQKSKHLLGSEVSWCNHRLAQNPKEAFSQVRVHAGTTQVVFEVDRPPPPDSPPGDLLITMVKETVIISIKKSFENEKKVKLVRISH